MGDLCQWISYLAVVKLLNGLYASIIRLDIVFLYFFANLNPILNFFLSGQNFGLCDCSGDLLSVLNLFLLSDC